MVEVADEPLDPGVFRIFQQVPVQAVFVRPLALLRELAAHEKQLLAGVGPHETKVGAQVGEALPPIARHPADQRTLAVHDLVVAQRQDEVLGEGVEQAEGQVVLMEAAVDRLVTDVAERVVHPAHVPLVAEAEPAQVGGAGDRRPGRRFLGDGRRPRVLTEHQLVGLPQESDGLEVLVAAVLVGDPVPFLARVVEVEHRGDRIDAQSVDMELVEPEQAIGDEKVADLGPAVVVDQGVPVAMEALARVGMLVEGGAVEPGEAVRIGRKVPRHPVDDDADARSMAGVDKGAELLRRPMPDGRREKADGLVTPRTVERILAHRHELDVGEAHLLDVGHEPLGELDIGEVAARSFADPLPGAEMHLVDAHRPVGELALGPLRHPLGVAPVVVGQAVDDARRLRRVLGAKGHRIGLERQQLAARSQELVLVVRSLRDTGDEQLEDAALEPLAHDVAAAVPPIEVADDAAALRVRRPDREAHAGDTVDLAGVRAQLLVEPPVAPLGEQVDVDLAQERREAVGIVDDAAVDVESVGVAPAQAVDLALEEPGIVGAGERGERLARGRQHADVEGAGLEGAQALRVDAQDREGIAVATLDDGVDGGGVGSRGGSHHFLSRCDRRQA